jgi:hypothetical protein
MSADAELTRQYRVARQSLAMHTMLRDRFTRLATVVDVVILTCSVIICAVRFARDDLFARFGLSASAMRDLVGFASVAVFILSIIALRVDWKARSANHREAVRKLTSLVAQYRSTKLGEDAWLPARAEELQMMYWEAMDNVVPIPSRQFAKLKARYLRGVEVSKMLDSRPGCPVWVLRTVLLYRSIRRERSRDSTLEEIK